MLSDSNSPQPIVIDQSEDFLPFKNGDQELRIDVVLAHAEMVKIDIKHQHDPWVCYACLINFPRPEMQPGVKLECPECRSPRVAQEPAWLESVARIAVEKFKFNECSVRAAQQFYEAIVCHVERLKKTPDEPQESVSGTA